MVAKMGLDGVRQGFEQIPVLPWADIKARRQRFRLSGNPTGKVPFDDAAAADSEDDGPKTVPELDQDCVVDEWLALVRGSDQIARRYVGERQIGGQRGSRQVRRPKSIAGGFPEGLALKELHSRDSGFSAAPELHH